jgi:hypothetical protein
VGLGLWREDEGEKVELYVGAAKSAIGLLPTLLVRVPAMKDAGELERRAASATTGAERCAVAEEAVRMLRRSAADEAFARGWLAHTGNVLLNGGGLLVVGLGYDRWLTGTLGAIVGIAVGEVQIFTRPTASLRGERTFRATWTIAPMVTGDATGVSVVGVF